MDILAITQARSGSTRLPGKVLKEIKGETLLDIHLSRILKSTKINRLLVATTTENADSKIVKIAQEKSCLYYRGSTMNVLDRYYQAAKPFKPRWIVRLTSDCPLIDHGLLDNIIEQALTHDADYCSNTLKPTYPDGMDVEVVKFNALERAWQEASKDYEKEHVTPYIKLNSSFYKKNKFQAVNIESDVSVYSDVRLTVDELEDFKVISELIEKIGKDASWIEYADYYLSNKEISSLNSKIVRDEGYLKSLQWEKDKNYTKGQRK